MGLLTDTPDRLVKHALEALLGERRALEVLGGSDIARHLVTLCVGDGLHPSVSELGDGLWVFSKIELGSDKNHGDVWCVVTDLRSPLGADVLKAWRADEREADEEHVRLRIGQGPESVVIFLTCRVPETEADRLAVHHDIRRVVVKHSRNVLSLR